MPANIEMWTPNNYNCNIKAASDKRKKRKRISHTCTSCKTRKVKCDQGRPCSSCVKKNIPAHLCIYDSSPFIPSPDDAPTPKEALLLLTEENKKLKLELDEIKNKSITSSPRAPGKVLKKFRTLTFKRDKVIYYGPTSWRSMIESKPAFHEVIETAKLYVSNARREWKVAKNLKKADPETYKDLISPVPKELLKNLADYLPDFFKIKDYLDIYFHSYWHYKNPVVDSKEVMKSFHELFQMDVNSEKFKIVYAGNSCHYAKIALIVLIFKFVLIQTNAIDSNHAYDGKDHLLKFVDTLLVLSRSSKRTTVVTLQCLLIRHQMKKINPFEDDGGDGSNSAFNLRNAVNMALILGLNTDIDEAYADKDIFFRGTLRSMWLFILKEDTILSFNLGIPLSISDEYLHKSSLDYSLKDIKLMMLLRQAIKVLVSHEDCQVDELVSIVTEIEQMESESLSKDIRPLSKSEDYVTNFLNIKLIETRIMAINALHVLYEVIYAGLEEEYPEDPLVEAAYNGIFKYGALAVTHLIELLLRLECACRATDEENKKSNGGTVRKVHNIVEVSSSITSLSKLAFLKVYCTLCSHTVRGLASGLQSDLRAPPRDYPLSVDQFEKLDIRDKDSLLNKAFRIPGFLHGLITLACKHMLYINNESYGHVFNFNFCLYAVIALCKYFNNYINNNLPKEQVELATKIQPNITYNQFQGPHSVSSERTDRSIIHEAIQGGVNPPKGPNILNPITGPLIIQPKYATPLRTNTPQNALKLVPAAAQNFGFFEWKNDAVDEMFRNILSDETLFTLDEQNNAVNWSLDEMFNIGGKP